MTTRKTTSCLVGALLLGSAAFLAAPVHAEDIDIYGSTGASGSSNLVIILDNAAATNANSTYTCDTSSWPAPDDTFAPNDPSKNFGFEQCGLYGALVGLSKMLTEQKNSDPAATSLPLRLGLMDFPSGGINGGQFIQPDSVASPDGLTLVNESGIEEFKDRVRLLSRAKDAGDNNQFSQALQESFAFYNGLKGLSGTQYTAPASPDSCARNYVVYITLATNNQKPQDGGNRAANALTSTAGPYTELTLPPYRQSFSPYASAKQKGNYQSDPSDEWSRFMVTGKGSNGKQYNPVTAYTIILYDGSNPEYEQLMKNVAVQSGSTPLFVELGDTQGLIDAISRVMRQVMAANSVFAAPVLPVSANTQGTYANQVFIGMFRPDGNGLPRWMGNLKQYQFHADMTDPSNPVLILADATGKAALSSTTGFLDPSALSFWTSKNTKVLPDKAGGFWLNAVASQGATDGYDSPDGQVVERGGVSQQIRLAHLQDAIKATASPATYASTRDVFTCSGTSCVAGAALSSMNFDAGNAAITDASLGTGGMSGVTRENLINWTRGADVAAKVTNSGAGDESSAPPDSTITVRGSVHGDVLHSRPAVINYGGTTGTVVFYGANDGLFRAVNGNQPNNKTDPTKPYGNCTVSADCGISIKDSSGTSITVPPGGELWSFIPSEFYGKLMRIYENSVQLTLGQPASATVLPKTYFFDGSPAVYQNGGTAYLFISARRGGRLLYALDVSDPAAPKFMWKIDDSAPGFAELGQTWSQPKVAMVKGHTGPVLIFGAGYDPNEDEDPPASADTMGRGIFIVDATTGKMVWSVVGGGAGTSCTGNPCALAAMTYSIPGDITLVDRDSDGYIDRLYAGDTGGNLWRVDLRPAPVGSADPDNDTSNWQASLFAALGGTGSPHRKFFFPPDVVVTKTFDAVAAVTGDREHPLSGSSANSVKNRFYMIKDTNVGDDGSNWTPVRDDTGTTVDVKPDALFDATSATYDNSGSGYYITLEGAGEKGVNAPVSFGGSVYFGTNQPVETPLTCKANLGEARGYRVNFLSGATVSNQFVGGGLPPSPVVGIVEIVLSDGSVTRQPFVIGGGGGQAADGTSALGVERAKIPIPTARRRTYWYRVIDQ